MGSSDSADGKALLKESFKRDYLRKGHSEEQAEKMAETAATGR